MKFPLFLIFLLTSLPSYAESELHNLFISSGKKIHKFRAEISDTVKKRKNGLMFRKNLDDDKGMLFVFDAEAEISMWMKDTFIPLDMIFIKKDGTISKIFANATPKSEESIPSDSDVYAVLEVKAGMTKKLGIKQGDKVVSSPLFKDSL